MNGIFKISAICVTSCGLDFFKVKMKYVMKLYMCMCLLEGIDFLKVNMQYVMKSYMCMWLQARSIEDMFMTNHIEGVIA